MEKIISYSKKNVSLILFTIAIIITSIVMFVFVYQKNGWHEDEIFSYGSSNYKYDNLLQRFGSKDSLNQLVDEKIIGNNMSETMQNIMYYINHKDEFLQELNKKIENEKPIWKTKEDAKEYVAQQPNDIFSYWSVYYNQARDVHPPLFYILVHLVSTFYLNNFSKYIIFIINLLFYIGTCLIIRKIMILFNKEKFSGISVLLYGLSMGTISIVMFQRMYMMLGFFVLLYLYFNLKIAKNSFEIDKKTGILLTLTVILGFLTQYYFCIYALSLAVITALIMIFKKKIKSLGIYIWQHIKAAIIGVVLFPPSIYHIFFSYRGAAGGVVDTSYVERLKEYLGLVFYSFSIPEVLGYIIAVSLLILLIIKLIYGKRKDIILMICLPVILFILTIAKIAPFMNIRYISPIFSIIVVGVILIIISVINTMLKHINSRDRKIINLKAFLDKYLSVIVICIITIVLSVYGFAKQKPEFLYQDYKKRIEIAEENHNSKLVYIGESPFNHLQDMEEFLRYDNYIIVNTWELEVLENNEVLQNENEYILNIKCWISNYDENFNKVLEYTNAKNYELLLDDGQSKVYRVFK